MSLAREVAAVGKDKAMEETRSENSYWVLFAGVTLSLIVLAAIRWSLAHPYGIHWDEATYINEALIDTQRLRSGMLVHLAARILLKSWGRAPAYRLFALPFLGLFGFRTLTARLVTLGCFVLSSWFLYLAGHRLGSRAAGAFAVLIFCLSPEIVSSSIFFSTEGPLYLSISAMFYYLFLSWSDGAENPRSWIGLGLAIGTGLLSKASFVIIVGPVLAFWLVEIRRKHLPISSLASLRKASIVALLVAGPWWLCNIKQAIGVAHIARAYVRDSLGSPSLMTWMRWVSTVLQSLLGIGLSILIGLVVIAYFRKAIAKREAIFDPLQRLALGSCACGGIPIVLAQLSGTNHLLRHVSPAVIPLAISLGVLSDQIGWTRSWAATAISSVLFCAQLLMLVTPVLIPNKHVVEVGFVNGDLPWRVMARFDQWDWNLVKNISDSCGLKSPTISYLGAGRAFNQPQIEYPWVAQNTSRGRAAIDYPTVIHLWRYEDGSLDWQKVMDSVAQSDLTLTAPRYVGEVDNKEDLDNQYNAEFATRLARDARFRGPIRLQMGRFEPVEVLVFLNNSLVCQTTQSAATR